MEIVPKLYANGTKLAIATHSDEQEFVSGRQASSIDPKSHILGRELALAVLRHSFSDDIASSFFIVAHSPRAHNQMDDPLNCFKRYHMREVRNHFKVAPTNILFFDDDEAIVNDCVNHCGVKAFKVDEETGFRMRDLLDSLTESLRGAK